MKPFLALLSAMLAMAPCASMAQGDEPAVWSVAGKNVLVLRAVVGGMTPLMRVEELDVRLNEMLSKADCVIGAADIVVKRDKGTVRITVKGDLLVTVNAGDAAANHMTADKLGAIWLANIRRTVPQLSPRENKLGA